MTSNEAIVAAVAQLVVTLSDRSASHERRFAAIDAMVESTETDADMFCALWTLSFASAVALRHASRVPAGQHLPLLIAAVDGGRGKVVEAGEAPPRFVMLNPSTADDLVDDPTIRRCIGFARDLGHGGIAVLNLYAYRAAKPADLWKADEPTGGHRNDLALRSTLVAAAEEHAPVIAAWGAHAKPEGRVADEPPRL